MSTNNKAPQKPELNTEVAHRLRDPFETSFLDIIETNDPLLMERGHGSGAWELYHDLMRDGKVFAGLQKRKLAVVAREWKVEPVEDTPKGKKDAETLSDILRGINFDQLCDNLLDATLLGWQVGEIVWTTDTVAGRQMIVPARVPMRAHRRFVFRHTDTSLPPQLHLLTQSDMMTGEPLPERKFIVHRVNPRDDNPYGTGLGLQLYWPVFFKRKGVLAWNKLNDRFGTPTAVAKYRSGATLNEKRTLLNAIKSISNDGGIVIPEGALIELLESKTGNFSGHRDLCEYMDDWIMEVLLGQSPRGKGGGAVAAASKEREDVRIELSQADSDLLCETLNSTLLAWTAEYNGLEPCRVSRLIEPEEDVKAMAETDVLVASMGFKPTLEYVQNRYGEGWEETQQPVPPAGVISSGSDGKSDKLADFAEADTPPQRDALDDLIDAELDNYQPLDDMTKPVLDWLEDAEKRGLTAEEAIAELPGLLQGLDADALAESLGELAVVARLSGNEGLQL